MTRRLTALLIACAMTAFAQQNADSLRISIHQMESEQHRWDDLKLVQGNGEFVHGKACAMSGDVKQAIVHFQKGARKNKAAAYFNIGLAYFQLHNYPVAIQYFKKSERVKYDPVCRSYQKAAARILKEQSKASRK
jgi:tetratricopeptide (TPR) repeat protein